MGIAGVLVARGLGPEGRGVYSLVNQASAWSVAFVVPGLADAAVYLWGRRRYDLRALWGNYLAWWAGVAALLSAGALAVLAVGQPLLGMTPWQLSLALVAGWRSSSTRALRPWPWGRGWPVATCWPR